MNKLLTILTLLAAVTLVGYAAIDDGSRGKPMVRQAFLEVSPGTFSAAEYIEKQEQLFSWLMAEATPLSGGRMVTLRVSPEDLVGINDYQCRDCVGVKGATSVARKVRIGVVKPTGNIPVDFSRLRNELSETGDGGFVWTMALESPGATALRVHISNINLPENAVLYVYNSDGEAFGPYTAKHFGETGEFWTNTVVGPVVYVQLRHFGPYSLDDLRSVALNIDSIGYLGEKFRLAVRKLNADSVSSTGSFCKDNAPCVEDASCHDYSVVSDARKAIAHMQWVAGVWIYYCSGGLVADTVPDAPIPYFLTANHCLSKDKDARNLECFFQYATSACGGACGGPDVAFRTLGSTVLSSNRSSDYTLLQLEEDPPQGSAFLGWTIEDVANANGAKLYRISHPQGSPQAYSEHEVDASTAVCRSWPRGAWIYSRDVVGGTEGGSSGAPVINALGQIVGQLSGACGYNVNDSCDRESNATVDGAFAAYYSSVKAWLDPQQP